jgi:hypothetical protein
MSAAEMVERLKTMPEAERESVFASLIQNPEWRADLVDLITIAARRHEPSRSLDDVLKDLKIDAWSGA